MSRRVNIAGVLIFICWITCIAGIMFDKMFLSVIAIIINFVLIPLMVKIIKELKSK